MKALINTKSNYRNLNNTWLPIHKIVGNRVTCLFDGQYGKQQVDFTLTEIKEIR